MSNVVDDMIGQRFGNWTVLALSGRKDSSHNKYYKCQCDCGNIGVVAGHKLRTGRSKSCGCGRTLDMTGKKIEHLTFIKRVGQTKCGRYVWECQCDCGNIIRKTISDAKNIKSCGCVQKKSAQKSIKENSKRLTRVDNTCLNSLTQKTSKNNTSGIKGVSWNSKRKKWIAQITFKGKNYGLGSYSTKEEAIRARKEAEEKLFKPILEKYNYEKKGE
jgi:hypothetical protein